MTKIECRIQQQLAKEYRPDQRLDTLIAEHKRDPMAFTLAHSPAVRLTVGHYQLRREAWEKQGQS